MYVLTMFIQDCTKVMVSAVKQEKEMKGRQIHERGNKIILCTDYIMFSVEISQESKKLLDLIEFAKSSPKQGQYINILYMILYRVDKLNL